MTKLAVTAALALIATTSVASAYDRQGEIDRRESRQEQRIQQGIRSGEITRHEARQLEAEQARIRQLERNAQRDGHIDRYEAARIREAQNAASHHIRQEANDGDRRRWAR